MAEKKATFAEIAKLLRNDPETFATNLLGEAPTLRTGTNVRYFDNQSLLVNIAGPAQGRFQSFTDNDAKGDMIDLVMYHHGLPNDKAGRHQALEIAKSHLGITDGKIDTTRLPPEKSQEERQREIKRDEEKRVRAANWIWENGSPTSGKEMAQAYLRNRGITIDIPSSTLRYRILDRNDLEKMGVAAKDIPSTPVVSLIFASRNEKGEIRAVQQVLTTEGRKVSFENPKRTNGHMPGSAVVLGNLKKSDCVALVEGPETALSVFQSTGMPTMITLGTSNFTKVHIPSNIKQVITVSDMEPTGVGLCSALKSAQYWSQQGIERSGIAIPPRLNDGDFNDVHQKFGAEAVKSGVEGAFFPPRRDRDGTILITPDARAAFYAWAKTGIEVAAKVPPKDKAAGRYRPFSIDGMVEDHHNRVLIVGNPAFEIKTDGLKAMRPGIEIVMLHEDSREFRKLARTPNGMQAALNAADLYAPEGLGDKEAVFFSLRRTDADALSLPDHKSVAVRSSSIDKIDYSFMRGRRAIVAPLGKGTEPDRQLTKKLQEAGAQTIRLTWQIFRGDDAVSKIIRRDIPDGYGAKDAAEEGWTGDALRDLIDISRLNRAQILNKKEKKQKVKQAEKPGEER